MSATDSLLFAGVSLPRRSGAPAGLLAAAAMRKSGRTLARLIVLIVLVLSIIGLWTSAGLARDTCVAGAPAAVMEPASG